MKLARFCAGDDIIYGQVRDEKIYQLAGDVFSTFKITDRTFNLADVKLLAPVLPKNIICVGLNYLAHIDEVFKGPPRTPQEPVIFMVPNTAVIAQDEPIRIPHPEHETHYEAELIVVIGKKCREITPAEAEKHILGYTCGNDVSDRDIQRADKQWCRAKGFHTFKPMGPFIETELDPRNLRIQCRVNGKICQDSNTGHMIRDVYYIVSFLSGFMTLNPGDVIYSGTPNGVGRLSPGDLCEIEIEGIGVLRNPVVFG